MGMMVHLLVATHFTKSAIALLSGDQGLTSSKFAEPKNFVPKGTLLGYSHFFDS
jgi:hypothetical protein